MNFLIFDLTAHLHFAEHLRALFGYWCQQQPAGTLYLFVWPSFFRTHAEIVALADCAPRDSIQFLTLTREEQKEWYALSMKPGGVAASVPAVLAGNAPNYIAQYEWDLFCRTAVRLDASHSFIVYLDRFLPLLAAGAEAPGPFSGIYFAPTFHYPAFGHAATTAAIVPAQAQREKLVLARALRNPQLKTLFCFDPFAVAPVQKFSGGHKARLLADPVTIAPVPDDRVQEARAELGIKAGRRVLLLFGDLSPRKGIFELFDALDLLAGDSSPGAGVEFARRTCLLLIGTIHHKLRQLLEARIDALARVSSLQVVTRYGYASGAQAAASFQLADIVLVPYPRHNGMSGILLLAAAYRKPVLSSAYGVLGEMTRRYRLGLAIDVAEPAQFAAALVRVVNEEPSAYSAEAEMDQLAAEHAGARFAAEIFQALAE